MPTPTMPPLKMPAAAVEEASRAAFWALLATAVVAARAAEPIAAGPFEPSWESLEKYETPAWFRDAKFDPDAMLASFKRAGARYLVAMANHHDNFDLWDSKHQPWNAAAIGPQRDIIGAWAREAYREKFARRVRDLVDRYEPELLYFDDLKLPLADTPRYGLEIAAHLYHRSLARTGGHNEAAAPDGSMAAWR